MTAEVWRPVVGNPWYSVSSLGRVVRTQPARGTRRGKILSPGYTTAGYPSVVLMHPDEPKRTRYVHHLVAEAFIGPRPVGLEIRHMDGDPANCQVGNLRYGTTSENAYDRVRHGTHWQARKTHCKHGHPFDEANTRIVNGRHRMCRACKSDQQRALRKRLRAAGISRAA